MNRRKLLQAVAGAGLVGVLAERARKAEAQVARGTQGLPAPKIRDVSVIATAPAGLRLTVVKISTDQDGLYGYGCGTFTQRAELVNAAIEKYLKPFLIGKPADRIEDTWQALYNSSYWRNGPVLNNAISGVDQALWDIKARQAGMPVYQVLGGKCREAVDCYTHAEGAEISETIDNARKFMARGFRHVRVQVGCRGWKVTARRTAARAFRRCIPGRSLSRVRQRGGRLNCSRHVVRSWAGTSNCCTTCTSVTRRISRCNW